MKIDPLRLMRWAEDVASDSTCAKIKVGAVLVTPRGQVISTGFNGTPPGHEHCNEHFKGIFFDQEWYKLQEGGPKTGPSSSRQVDRFWEENEGHYNQWRTSEEFLKLHSRFSMERELHAEENCLHFADPDKVRDSTLVCTWSPCWSCAKTILTRDIAVVYYRTVYQPEVIDYLGRFVKMEKI